MSEAGLDLEGDATRGQLNIKAKFSRATRHLRAELSSEKIELAMSVAWRLTSVILDFECAAAWSFEVSC